MNEGESPMSSRCSASTNVNASLSPRENGFNSSFSLLNSEKAVQEIIQQPMLHGVDDHLTEFSEALRTVAKALTKVKEGKALAQAEAAECKHKYELERARNLQLEQNVPSSGGHCRDQTLLSDENTEQCELCSGRDDICAHEVLREGEPDFESSNAQNKMMRKVPFKLSWYCKGEKRDRDEHDIVYFEKDFFEVGISSAHCDYIDQAKSNFCPNSMS